MSKFTVYVTRKIPKEGLEILKQQMHVKCWDSEDPIPRDELLKNVSGVHGILCTISDQIDKQVLQAAGSQLKAVSTMSVGETHIDKVECQKRGIEVANTPDVASDSAAEFTCSLVLLTARRLLDGMVAVANGEWGLWRPMWILGCEMGDKTIGIVGFGRVGFGVARRLRPFNIKKIIYNDVARSSYADTIEAQLVPLDTLLEESDFVCICCAATPATTKLFNKETFAKMKEGSILINTARGVIVDHEALFEGLEKGRPGWAALDVTEPEPLPRDHPLLKHPKCIITPHMATSTWQTRVKMAINAATNLQILLCGEWWEASSQ